MKHTVETIWQGGMKFEANIDNHSIIVDAPLESGGTNMGPSPKKLLLVALAGCTGMDVVSILKKMKVEFESFNMLIDADASDEHPKRYTTMHIIYKFKGKNLDPEKLKRAVSLSQEQYCGVAAIYKRALDLTYEIQISNG